MSASTPAQSYPAIVAKLRAAGCVFAEDEARLLISCAPTAADLAAMVDRRAAGLPLEHVVGWAEFCGLRVSVDPGVFVPRRRSEFLVGQAAAFGREAHGQKVVIVDLCCGSGAVGLALAAAVDLVELHAVDIEPAAVRCARRNVAAMAPGAHVYEGDLYQPLPVSLRAAVAVLVANAPYVPSDAVAMMPAEARSYEPLVALDGGADGLDVMRRIAAAAPLWLAPGGHLLIETSDRQSGRAVEIIASSGLTPQLATSAELNAAVVIGTRNR
jgi:release factor glutamine methyltransferase